MGGIRLCGAGETPALLDVIPDPPSRRLTVCSGVMFNAGRCQVDAYWLHLVTLFSSASQFPTWRPEDSGVSWWQLTAEAVARFSRGDAEFQVWQTANRLRRSLGSTILYCTTLTHGSHGMGWWPQSPGHVTGLDTEDGSAAPEVEGTPGQGQAMDCTAQISSEPAWFLCR